MFQNHQFLDLNASTISGTSEGNLQTFHDIPATYIPYDELEFYQNSTLGHGSFGEVRQAYYHTKNLSVAIKFQAVKEFEIEVKQLARFDFVNIIQLYGWTQELDRIDHYGIVMELMEGGSLHKVLRKTSGIKYNVSHALSWCLQAARGLEYLHTMKPKKVIHRDIKPLNLLLDRSLLKLKICDFGTTCDLQTMMSTQRGTFVYMAPEVFRGEKYDEKCDVYSWAVTFWQCLAREEPFNKIENPFALMFSKASANLRLPKLKRCPTKITDMVEKCTLYSGDRSFEKRYSMTEVVRIMEELVGKCRQQPTPLEFMGEPKRFNTPSSTQRRTSDGSCIQPTEGQYGHTRTRSSGTIIPPTVKNSYLDQHRTEVDTILREFNAYMLLDDRYKPLMPLINNSESLYIFRQHREMSKKILRYFLYYKNIETHYKKLEAMKQRGDANASKMYIELMDENSSLKNIHMDYLEKWNQAQAPVLQPQQQQSPLMFRQDNVGNFRHYRQPSGPPVSEEGYVFVRHQDAPPS